MTAFGLTEALQLLAAPPQGQEEQAMLPLEGHAYFEQAEQSERAMDGRLMWTNSDGDVALASEYPQIALRHRRMRVRFRGLKVPPWQGYLHLVAEWRLAGSDGAWERSKVSWPVEVVPPPAGPVPPTPAP